MTSGIDRAVDAAGSVPALAKALGISHQAVYVWQRQGWCPQARALQIEKMYKIPRNSLLSPRFVELLKKHSAA